MRDTVGFILTFSSVFSTIKFSKTKSYQHENQKSAKCKEREKIRSRDLLKRANTWRMGTRTVRSFLKISSRSISSLEEQYQMGVFSKAEEVGSLSADRLETMGALHFMGYWNFDLETTEDDGAFDIFDFLSLEGEEWEKRTG
ncbi:hypothetical protein NE237_010606 [Protea cynaroides]|uniref:Uncharacterized protein n=1 Tax=Protea cynaroides TaxID=273540 RepID=A0A9Q0L029_9MAGN|nr:hypothetical protein NE237_010606 [Protea cynaroides]